MKKIILSVISLLLSASLASCGFAGKIINRLFPRGGEDTTFETEIFDVTDSPDEFSPRIPDGGMPYFDTVTRYAWMTLDGQRRALYYDVLEAALSYAPRVSLPDDDTAAYIWECVFFDTPELFYVSETPSIKDGVLTFNYAFDREYAEKTSSELDAAYNEFISAQDGDSTYERIIGTYEYIINRTKYDFDAEADYEDGRYNERLYRATSAAGPLLDGRSICIGYARATQYLALRQGIQTYTVKGYGNSGRHYYSLMLFDDGYYYVDTTWGDPVGSDRSIDYLTYYYFGMTTEELLRSHEIWSRVPLPLCTATAYNYFVYNGFTADTAEQVARAAFDNYEKGVEETLIRINDYEKLGSVYNDLPAALYDEAAARGIECPPFGFIRSTASGVIGVVFR